MSIALSLNNALSGLRAAQLSLSTISNNVANANTEGYTKKYQPLENAVYYGVGSGVRAGVVERRVDELLRREVRSENSRRGAANAAQEFLSRVQDLLGAPANGGRIGSSMTEFSNAMDAMALSPENLGNQRNVVLQATELAGDINESARELQRIRGEIDGEVAKSVTEINENLAIIQKLNSQIANASALGQSTAELQDQRDLAVSKVAEHIDVTTFTRNTGEMVVLTRQGTTLVDGIVNKLSFQDQEYAIAGSNLNPITVGGIDISGRIGSGRLAALIQTSRDTIPTMYSQLNELARQLVVKVQDGALATTAIAGPPLTFQANRMFGGFDPTAMPANAAELLRLHPQLDPEATPAGNPGLLRPTPDPAPSLSQRLSDTLRTQYNDFNTVGSIIGGPTNSFNLQGFSTAIVSTAAILSAQAESTAEQQTEYYNALIERTSNLDGVNVDEEMANMVVFQNAYAASARALETARQMFDTLLAIGT